MLKRIFNNEYQIYRKTYRVGTHTHPDEERGWSEIQRQFHENNFQKETKKHPVNRNI